MKNKKIRIKKLDNRGSSMLLVIVAAMFVMLLASAVMAASYANLLLKQTEKTANQAFYTAEKAVDKIYTVLGDEALQSVSDAYVMELGEIVQDDDTLINNDAANVEMKTYFVEDYLRTLTGNGALTATGTYIADETQNTDKLTLIAEYLNDCLDDVVGSHSSISVKSVGGFTATANDPKYCLVIKDVVINYLSATDYYSDITTDFLIEYPPLDVMFNNDKDDDFLDYCLIAEHNIGLGNFNTNDTGEPNDTVVNATASAGLYAGNNLNINNGSQLILQNGTHSVAHKKVVVNSGDLASTLIMGNATLWSNGDLELARDEKNDAGAVLNTSSESVLYVQDDLEFDADGSKATLKGSYYGYGWGDNADAKNASIIMNGRFGTLDMDMFNLEILGRAYIETLLIEDMINGRTATGYENGESVNVKTNQAIYLVQDTYLKLSGTNPIGIGNVPDPDPNNNFSELVDYDKLKSFFAYSLLDPITPVVLAKDESRNLCYLYYNFSSAENKELYVKAILTGTLNGVSVTGNTSYQEEYQVLLRGVKRSFYDYGTKTPIGGIAIKTTNKKILGPYATSMGVVGGTGSITVNDGTMLTSEAETRSNEIKGNLISLYKMMAEPTVYDTIINRTRATAVGSYENEYTTDDGVKYDLIVTNEENPEITSKNGIIVHNGSGALVIRDDFNGLIVSDGTIAVKGDAVLTTDRATIDMIIKSTPEFARFFRAYSVDNDEDFSIANIAYGDIIHIQNWRKYED